MAGMISKYCRDLTSRLQLFERGTVDITMNMKVSTSKEDDTKASQQPIAMLLSIALFGLSTWLENLRDGFHKQLFDYPFLLTGLYFFGTFLTAIYTVPKIRSLSKQDLITLFLVGVGEFLAKLFTALGFMRIPLVIDVVSQSAKTLPVILFRRYVFRTKGSAIDDILGVMIVFGITVCGLADCRLFTGFSVPDVIMQILAICLDALVVNWEFSLITKEKFSPGMLQGFSSIIGCLAGLIGGAFHDIPNALVQFKGEPGVVFNLFCYVLASGLMVAVFFQAITRAGLITPVMMTTIKKSVGVLVAYYTSKPYEMGSVL